MILSPSKVRLVAEPDFLTRNRSWAVSIPTRYDDGERTKTQDLIEPDASEVIHDVQAVLGETHALFAHLLPRVEVVPAVRNPVWY